jgi:hypothetical protein
MDEPHGIAGGEGLAVHGMREPGRVQLDAGGIGVVAAFALLALLSGAILWNVGVWYKHHRFARLVRGHAHKAAVAERPRGTAARGIAIILALIFSKYIYLASLTNYYTFYLIHRRPSRSAGATHGKQPSLSCPIQFARAGRCSPAGRSAAHPMRWLARWPWIRWIVADAGETDPLVAKRRHQLQLSSERGDISFERRDDAIVEARTSFQARDVSLIHVRRLRHIDLRLSSCLAKGPKREVYSALRAQSSTQDSHRLCVGCRASLGCRAHGSPPVS